MWKSSLAFAVFLISIKVFSQDKIVVNGKVVDAATHESLPGTSIFYKGTGTTSDNEGNFTIVASRGDTLEISFVGYERLYQLVHSETLTASLVALSKKLGEVVVSADRIIAEEFTSKKLGKLDIYRNPSAKADPILAVNSMPYATTTDESANISLRGGSPDETGIFLNDVPINDAIRYSQLNGLGTFSIFNTAIINKVLVYPGNPPLEYGNSTSGVIALSTEEQIPDRRMLTASLTLAGAGVYTSFKIDSTSSLTLFSNFQNSALFIPLNGKSIQNLKSFSSADLGVHYFKNFSRKLTMKVFNYSLSENYNYHYIRPTYSGIFKQTKRRNFTVANLKKQIGKYTLAFNQGLSFSTARYDYSTLDMKVALKDYYGSFNAHRFTETSEWKTGVMYFYQASGSGGQFPVYDFAYGENYPVGNFSSSESIETAEGFGYYKKYFGNWIIGAGVRKNLPLSGETDYLSYQGNIRYVINNWKIIAAAGNYNKYLFRQGEAGKEFLQSKQFSLDFQYETKTLESSISVFHKRSLSSGMETNIMGLELFSRYRFSSRLSSQISVTSLDAFGYKNEDKTPSPYNIRYFIRGNVEYKIQGTWAFTLVYLFRQGSYYYPVAATRFREDLNVHEPVYDSSLSRLPAYNTIDLSASKIFEVGKKITATAFMSVANVMDFRNTRGYIYNADYSSASRESFSRRLVFFGCVMNF